MNEYVNLISSVGFPIVACIFLFKQNADMMKTFQKSIDNNTKAIETLKDTILEWRRSMNEDL